MRTIPMLLIAACSTDSLVLPPVEAPPTDAGCNVGCEAPEPVCGDGAREIGEVCIGRTIVIASGLDGLKPIISTDLNQDGLLDFVLHERVDAGSSIYVLLNERTRFRRAWSTTVQTDANVVADLDGDLIPDLILVGTSTGSFLRGVGDGTFAALAFFETTAGRICCGVAEDFNRDGRTDLAVFVEYGDRPGAVHTISDLVLSPAGVEMPWPFQVADVDGDLVPDLFHVPAEGPSARWARGLGDGTFADVEVLYEHPELTGIFHAPRTSPGFVARLGPEELLALRFETDRLIEAGVPLETGADRWIGDLDEDEDLEVIDAWRTELRIRSLPSGELLYSIPAQPLVDWLTVWDGHVVEWVGPTAHVHRRADAGFADPELLELDTRAYPVELDGDDLADFVAVWPGPMLGAARGSDATHAYSFPAEARRIELDDIDADGTIDLTAIEAGDLVLRRGTGEGRFAPPELLQTEVRDLAIGEFDGDGTRELATVSRRAIHLGATTASVAEDSNLERVFAADFTGDGADDLLVETGRNLHLFTASPLAEVASVPLGDLSVLAVADLDGDRHADVVIGRSEDVMILSGALALSPTGSIAVGSPLSATAGDFDADGIADLALGREGGVEIVFGESGRTTLDLPDFQPTEMRAADFDGDGVEDLMAVGRFGFGPDYTMILSLRSERTLQNSRTFAVRSAFDIAVADLDQDGLPDLVTSGADLFLPIDVTVYLSYP